MQINATEIVLPPPPPAQTASAASVRILAGNLTAVPLGSLLQATVTQVNPRDAVLNVNGQSLTVSPSVGLQAGSVLFVRVPKSGNGTLEIATPAARETKPQAPPNVPMGSTQLKVVDVTAALPDGRVLVQIEGQEQTATTRDPLLPGRFILEVKNTPTGLTLKVPAETPALPTEIATAIIRATPAPELATNLKPLQAELKALIEPQPQTDGAEPAPVVPAPVREAAVAVRDTIRALVPSEPRVLNATELQNLVQNGGIQFEAKLARLADPDPARASVSDPSNASASKASALKEDQAPTKNNSAPVKDSAPTNAAAPKTDVAHELKADLKGDLLRLLQTARELGVASQIPAAKATLDGIESQQATQTLAQATGTPYILQVPFPDRDQWRTLHLSVEAEDQQADDADTERRGGRFRMLMHVPLSELGETWIDAGLAGDSFRAAIYLDRAAVRERVSAALPELHSELQTEGFGEVFLDVRAVADLPPRTRVQSSAMMSGRPAALASLLDVRV